MADGTDQNQGDSLPTLFTILNALIDPLRTALLSVQSVHRDHAVKLQAVTKREATLGDLAARVSDREDAVGKREAAVKDIEVNAAYRQQSDQLNQAANARHAETIAARQEFDQYVTQQKAVIQEAIVKNNTEAARLATKEQTLEEDVKNRVATALGNVLNKS